MKKFFSVKKDDGSSYINMFSVVITIMAIAIVAMIFSSYMANLDRKTTIDSIARKYLLEMETEGYLSPANKAMLTTELTNNGFTLNPNGLEGTSMTSPVGYGNEIVLNIKGKLKIWVLTTSDLDLNYGTGTIDMEINKKSISKQ